jgi:hypothetical protein
VADLDSLGAAYPIEATGAWLAPVAVSVRDNVPLYSDDAVLRTWARTKGVPTFGTLALIEALIERGRCLPNTAEAMVSKLFHGNVVDLPTAWPLVVQTAGTNGPTTSPVLLNVTRSAFWHDIDRHDVGGVIVAIARPAGDDPVALGAIVTAMADGLTSALEPADQILAVLGATVLAHVSGVSPQAAALVIHAIQPAAARYDVDPIPLLGQHLTAILGDPSDAFRMSPEAARQVIDEALAAGTDQVP